MTGAAQPLTSRSGSDSQSPREGVAGWQESVARAERSGAGACLWSPLGGDEVRQGAATVRARCRADGGAGISPGSPAQGGGSAAAQCPCERGCTDRSADRCADRHTSMPAHARAFGAGRRGGRASAVCFMAQPWTMVAWARGPRDRTTLPPPRCADCRGYDRASLGACATHVVHRRWGKGCARAGELLRVRGLRQPACWGSRDRSRARERHGRPPQGEVVLWGGASHGERCAEGDDDATV